jgi:CheY-like chemotaxis protein
VGSSFTVLVPYGIGRKGAVTQSSPKNERALKAVNASQLVVLLVEDNDINRLYAKSILKNWQCFTDTAENGLVAIEKIKNQAYDVVLMDIQMPVMDGYETTKAIRLMNSPMRDVPVIALTANATKADVEKCMAAGMNDYLPKPFTPDDLYRKLFIDQKITPKQKAKTKTQVLSPVHQLYNLDYLRSVSGNNEEFIREMVLTFTQTIPPLLVEMKQALKESDWPKLARQAHQIKPSFTLMGLTELRSNILFIEENSKASTKLDQIPEAVMNFIFQCETVIPELSREVVSG